MLNIWVVVCYGLILRSNMGKYLQWKSYHQAPGINQTGQTKCILDGGGGACRIFIIGSYLLACFHEKLGRKNWVSRSYGPTEPTSPKHYLIEWVKNWQLIHKSFFGSGIYFHAILHSYSKRGGRCKTWHLGNSF